MKRLRVPILLVVAAAIGLTVYGALFGRTVAPGVTFVSVKGERVAMADLRGQVVLVEFWSTSCATCVREMPQLVATYQRYRPRGFETIVVAMKHDPPNYVLAYANSQALPFRVALDPMGEIARAFGDVKLTPTTFVIDRRGTVVARLKGARDFAELNALLEKKLEESI